MLSLYGGRHPASVVGTQVDGVPHFLSRPAAAVLRSLADAFECVWCTGWEERADEHLPALLDLPRGWPCVRFTDPPSLDLHWKLSAIDAFAGPDRAAGLDRRRPRRELPRVGGQPPGPDAARDDAAASRADGGARRALRAWLTEA